MERILALCADLYYTLSGSVAYRRECKRHPLRKEARRLLEGMPMSSVDTEAFWAIDELLERIEQLERFQGQLNSRQLSSEQSVANQVDFALMAVALKEDRRKLVDDFRRGRSLEYVQLAAEEAALRLRFKLLRSLVPGQIFSGQLIAIQFALRTRRKKLEEGF